MLPSEKKASCDNIWIATNVWMLEEALKVEGKNMVLIALWDGKGGDGNGGTKDMIEIAKNKGARIEIININKI